MSNPFAPTAPAHRQTAARVARGARGRTVPRRERSSSTDRFGRPMRAIDRDGVRLHVCPMCGQKSSERHVDRANSRPGKTRYVHHCRSCGWDDSDTYGSLN